MAVSFYNGNTIVNNSLNISYTPPSSLIPNLIGYAVSPGNYIYDCTTTFTTAICTQPGYCSGYTLGQIVNNDIYTGSSGANIFYTNAAMTTFLPSIGGNIWGIGVVNGGNPIVGLRIADGTLSSDTYNGYYACSYTSNFGYYVVSSTKVNVGNTLRCNIATGLNINTTPYIGQELYTNAGTTFTIGTTIAWALNPNVTATHLITLNAPNTGVVSSIA